MDSSYDIGRMPSPPCDIGRVPVTRPDFREASTSNHEFTQVSPMSFGSQRVQPPGSAASHSFITSWLLSPKTLALLRLTISTYCFATVFTVLVWQKTHADMTAILRGFSYFTNLTWLGLSVYFLNASIYGFAYTVHGRRWLDRWPRILQALHSFYYTTIITFPILVTVVYWSFIYERTWFPVRFDAWSNVSKHGLNSLFALIEIFLTMTNPPPIFHVIFLWVILGMYLGLVYITYWKQGWYTYGFLNPEGGQHTGRVVGYSIGVAAATTIIFLIVWASIWVRRKATAGREWKSERDLEATNGNGMVPDYARSDDIDLEMGREYA